jgi:hypothetical protein
MFSGSHAFSPVCSRDIIHAFKAGGEKVNGARVRKVVNYIRTCLDNGERVLAANSRGYYWTSDLEEVIRYSASLRNRMNEIRRVMYHINKYLSNYIDETTNTAQKEQATAEKNAITQAVQGNLFHQYPAPGAAG